MENLSGSTEFIQTEKNRICKPPPGGFLLEVDWRPRVELAAMFVNLAPRDPLHLRVRGNANIYQASPKLHLHRCLFGIGL